MYESPMVDFGNAADDKKLKWIEALESGKYSQCKGTLRGEDGFCCLGVWLDLQGVELEVEVFNPEENSLFEGPKHLYTQTWEDLGDFQDTGIQMNDQGKTFEEIAAKAREFYELPKKEEI